MRLAVVALLLIGCKEYEDFPPVSGGGPGGMQGVTDAVADSESDAPTDANLVTGRVCVVRDLRALTSCDPDNAGLIVVQIGNKQVETEEDGSFTIDVPPGTGQIWRVFHPDFVTSISELGTSFVLPAIRINDYSDLLGDNGVILTAGQSSSVVVQLLDGSAPLVGGTAVTSPAAQFQTRYDGNSAMTWDQDSTGTFGVAWLPGTTGTSAALTVTPSSDAPITTTIPLEADAITFATVSF
jgi:hypothetical protein